MSQCANACMVVSAQDGGPIVDTKPDATELTFERIYDQRFGDVERMDATDISDLIAYIVTRPWRVAINEVLIRPTEQEG